MSPNIPVFRDFIIEVRSDNVSQSHMRYSLMIESRHEEIIYANTITGKWFSYK